MSEITESFKQVQEKILTQINNSIKNTLSGGIKTRLSEIKDTTIMGSFIHEILTGQVSALQGVVISSPGIDESEVFVENTRDVIGREKLDIMLKVYSDDEKIDKKIRLAFFGGEDEGVIISPDLRINTKASPEFQRIGIALQDYLIDTINKGSK